jgi:hypothetical protein
MRRRRHLFQAPEVIGVVAGLALAACSCGSAIRSTAGSGRQAARIAELWVEPHDIDSRNLFYGVGGPSHQPDPKVPYKFRQADTTGYSAGYEVEDSRGVEWDVKLGPEARTEVVASRIIWAVGYHQRPNYYLPRWVLIGKEHNGPQSGGRFRPKVPGIKTGGEWSWYENPFVGTRPYRGLIVLNVLLGNSDLKPANNGIAQVSDAWGGPGVWYYVKDVGHTFGRTGRLEGTRGDPKGFAEHAFITGVKNGRVEFEWHGFHGDLLRQITPADVRWIADLLARLSDHQLADAFRAGGFDREAAAPFIRTLKIRIKQGQQVAG